MVGVATAFILGGLSSLTAMLVLRLPRKTSMPFGPWLATGAVLAIMVHGEIAGWCQRILLGR